MKVVLTLISAILLLEGCHPSHWQTFPPTHPALHWQGRIFRDKNDHMWMFGSASYLRFRFEGDSCKILLRNRAPGKNYNYISFVIDSVHTQRIRIDFDSLQALTIIPESSGPFHDVEVYKETEPKNGAIEIGGVMAARLDTLTFHPAHTLEFIGNSITAGMCSDTSLVPCGAGQWYDQHNAYDAFGPVVSRKLNCDFTIAAYSGLGMYRNWANDYPVMKDIYPSIMLNPDLASPRYDYTSFVPDVVVICMGSNDLADGDGVTHRPPFDSTRFINSYIDFIGTIHQHHPNAQFLMLNGPVNEPGKDVILRTCLSSIQSRARHVFQDLPPVQLYFFSLIEPHGCDGHPDIHQQMEMAGQIEPVLAKMLGS